MALTNAIENEFDIAQNLITDTNAIIQRHAATNLTVFHSSSFRKHIFHLKANPSIIHPVLAKNAGTKIRYCDVCSFLRSYIFKHGLSLGDGQIQCDTFLQSICGGDTASFFEILAHFKQIIE
jgi:hypothetical protein